MTEPRVHLVKSAQRVLEVLEYFDLDRPKATVTDISQALSYPQSSASVLLKCLRQLGFLYYNRFDRTYRPTARVALLGCWAEDGAFRGGKMLTLADSVAKRLGETVALSYARIDYVVHHLHVVPGTVSGAVAQQVGQVEPLLHSALGELLLASYPDKQIRLALHRLNAEEPDPERRVNIADKLPELQTIRERGWNRGDNAASDGVGTVALLMPRRKGGDRLVLSIVAESGSIARRGEEFLQTLMEERDRIFPSNRLDALFSDAHDDDGSMGNAEAS